MLLPTQLFFHPVPKLILDCDPDVTDEEEKKLLNLEFLMGQVSVKGLSLILNLVLLKGR